MRRPFGNQEMPEESICLRGYVVGLGRVELPTRGLGNRLSLLLGVEKF